MTLKQNEFPTGFKGKSWKDMTKNEVLDALHHLWTLNVNLMNELSAYERNIRNIQHWRKQ